MIRASLLALALIGASHAASQRVVTLGGDVTEIAFALNRGAEIVAVDSTSLYPDAALALPQVGYVRALSAEGVLALKPDLVLASGDAGPAEAIQQIRDAGVSVTLLPKDHSLAGIHQKIVVVAEALGATANGENLAATFDLERQAVTAAVGQGERLPAAFVMSRGDGALMVAGKGTAADAMLDAAGLRNVFGNVEGYKPVSSEMMLALAPEVIVTGKRTTQAVGGLERLTQNPALALTPAVKAGRVLVFEDNYLLGLGPRAARAARELAAAARR